MILHRFPSHLTHLPQPLDVGVFQTYKDWHSALVHQTINRFYGSYSTEVSLKDLHKIRELALKEERIKGMWLQEGIWPFDSGAKALQVAEKYVPQKQQEPHPPLYPDTPLVQADLGQELLEYYSPLGSSQSKAKLKRYVSRSGVDSWGKGILKDALTHAQLAQRWMRGRATRWQTAFVPRSQSLKH